MFSFEVTGSFDVYGSLKQDVMDDQRDKLSKLEAKVAELENQLRKKDDLIAVNVCVCYC